MFGLIILAAFVSGVVAMLIARVLVVTGHKQPRFTIPLTAFSSGVLLSTALLHLAPEAIHEGLSTEQGFWAIFIGIAVFFVIERMVIWYHHHDEGHDHEANKTPKPGAYLIATGDTIHNFIDGVALTAAFLVNPGLGLFTVLAIFLHEVPQEVADFTIMVRRGLSIKKATFVNLLSALAAIVGATLTYTFRDLLEPYLPWLIGISAGMFLYIALSDLIPELHQHAAVEKHRWTQLIWLAAGVVLIVGVGMLVQEPH